MYVIGCGFTAMTVEFEAETLAARRPWASAAIAQDKSFDCERPFARGAPASAESILANLDADSVGQDSNRLPGQLKSWWRARTHVRGECQLSKLRRDAFERASLDPGTPTFVAARERLEEEHEVATQLEAKQRDLRFSKFDPVMRVSLGSVDTLFAMGSIVLLLRTARSGFAQYRKELVDAWLPVYATLVLLGAAVEPRARS